MHGYKILEPKKEGIIDKLKLFKEQLFKDKTNKVTLKVKNWLKIISKPHK